VPHKESLVSFSEQPPSTHWAAMKYRGAKFGEVWFKPDGDPCALTFRIARASFQLPGIDKQLTLANLLKAVPLTPEAIDSWHHGDVCHTGLDAASPEFVNLLPAPPQDVAHLEIHVRLKPPPEAAPGADGSAADVAAAPEAAAVADSSEAEISPAMWDDLDTRWKAILSLEASIDTLRISMESLMAEMDGALKKQLTVEEKVHALRADVSHWTKEKKRALDAMPKMKDIIHRSVWSLGAPERKRLQTLYDEHIQPHVPFPHMTEVLKELQALQKTRQVLFSLGNSVYQDARGIAGSVQGALRTLQNNAAINAKKKRDSAKGGKFLKDVRRATGAG
jgi:hypothetical protein